MITNPQYGTNVHEIADSIYRIDTPLDIPGEPAFNFNQYLLIDDEPLLFHTGPRQLFPPVRDAIASLMPVERLYYSGLSHTEADECRSLNLLLGMAPQAVPLCSRIAAMVSINDLADRQPRTLADGEQIVLGGHTVQWFDTPHGPHGWDAGLLMDVSNATLICGDLFTQGGRGEFALTESAILGPGEPFRQHLDYFAHAPQTLATQQRLAQAAPSTLACMHGSAWRGDGGSLLRQLAEALGC